VVVAAARLGVNNQRAIYILVGLLILLIGVVYYLQTNPEAASGGTPTPTTAAPASITLWTFDSAKVQSFSVTDNEQKVTFAAQLDSAGVWSITQPTPGPASQESLGTMPTTLGSLFVSQTITENVDLAAFGLLQPPYTLEVKQSDGKTFRANIGKKAPTGSGYYVLREGEAQVLLVGAPSLDTLLGYLTAPPLATPTPAVTATLPVPPTSPIPTLELLPGLATPTATP
jgi:hypothetical protein